MRRAVMASAAEGIFFGVVMVIFAILCGVAIGFVGSIAWYTMQWLT